VLGLAALPLWDLIGISEAAR